MQTHIHIYIYIYMFNIQMEYSPPGNDHISIDSKASLRVLGGVLGVGDTWPWRILSVACIADQLGRVVMLMIFDKFRNVWEAKHHVSSGVAP